MPPHCAWCYLQVEQCIFLVLLPPEERELAPPIHYSVHLLHVGLSQTHPLLKVTNLVPCGLNVFPNTYMNVHNNISVKGNC